MSTKIKKYIRLIPYVKLLAKFSRRLLFSAISFGKWRQLARSQEIKLELGSGAKKGKDGWTTVDIYGADISRDLRYGIPLKDSTVTAIYTSHMFEHIPFKQLVNFLFECKRVLKDGGTLSVCVPNAGNYIRAYIEKREFRDASTFYMPAAVNTGSYLDQVNYIAYMGGNTVIYLMRKILLIP
jgi:ubiquinone/menaquinone biosynthesis C-methylase UbiE